MKLKSLITSSLVFALIASLAFADDDKDSAEKSDQAADKAKLQQTMSGVMMATEIATGQLPQAMMHMAQMMEAKKAQDKNKDREKNSQDHHSDRTGNQMQMKLSVGKAVVGDPMPSGSSFTGIGPTTSAGSSILPNASLDSVAFKSLPSIGDPEAEIEFAPDKKAPEAPPEEMPPQEGKEEGGEAFGPNTSQPIQAATGNSSGSSSATSGSADAGTTGGVDSAAAFAIEPSGPSGGFSTAKPEFSSLDIARGLLTPKKKFKSKVGLASEDEGDESSSDEGGEGSGEGSGSDEAGTPPVDDIVANYIP